MDEFELNTLERVRRRGRHRINLSRHVYNEDEFTQSFTQRREFTSSEFDVPSSLSTTLKGNFCQTKCTLASILKSWFPIVNWLPKYNVREDLPQDIAGGLTVGIMHVPQGNVWQWLHCFNPSTIYLEKDIQCSYISYALRNLINGVLCPFQTLQ